MKKLLLLGAATLMCAAVGKADVRYMQDGEPFSGTPAEVIAKMKEHQEKGGLYFLQVTKTQGPHSHSGEFVYSAHKDRKSQFRWDFSANGTTTIPETGETNNNKVYKIAVEEETGYITIQSMYSNHYFTIQGNNGYGKHHVWGSLDGTDYSDRGTGFPLTIAKYVIETPDATLSMDDDVLKDNRYVLKVTNATRDNDGNNPIYLQSYNNNDDMTKSTYAVLSYQSYPASNTTSQVVFFPIKEVVTIPATIKFPDWNGITMTETVEVIAGKSVEPFIIDAANVHGGLTNIQITSDNGSDLIASETNNAFTVTGNWNYDFEANQVYRISLNPGDNPSALRYMLKDEEIRNKIDGDETLSRLIPERLWFFKEGENPNSFSLHNLYDPSKGVHFSPNAQGSYNNAKATYEENYTYFNLVHSNVDNQFYLKIDGTENAYVNDYNSNGYFSIYHTDTPDNNCILQIYPLEKRDFQALGLPENTIPTVDNISEAVANYNAKNINAALRRIGYWGGEDLIGWQPGRFNNEANDFHEKLAIAHELQQKVNAGEEVDATILEQAVEDIDFTKLKFNAIKPGMFYRFKNKLSGMYLSSDSWGSLEQNETTYELMKLVDENQANFTNTIFYVDGAENGSYTIVSYETGLVLPDFNSSTTKWIPLLNSDDNAGHSWLIQHQHLRGCILHSESGGHRHLHGGNNVAKAMGAVNVSGNSTDDAHQWYVELVEELPVTFFNTFSQDDNEGWASVYSPVALEVPAKYTHTTAYTGEFDNTNYTGKLDINHVHATPIEPNEEGKVIIPANQPALLFYDGELDAENNPNLEQGEASEDRNHIVYLNLPIAFGHEATGEIKGNLKASFTAFANEDGTDFFTLHASTNNNFRPYEEYQETAKYIPGFKAYLDDAPEVAEGEKLFPIYTINPNTMVPMQDNEGYATQLDPNDNTKLIITLTTPSADYQVYYKHTPKAAAAPQRRAAAVDHTGYTLADHVEGTNVHTITVPDGNLEYYAYHPESNFKGVVRTATVNTTGIDEINAEGTSAKVYDLQGRRMAAPAKGINIINGKKVLVK